MLNYFELLHVPVSFHVDQLGLKEKFYELTKLYHPDRFANANPDKQEEAIELTSQLNTAYTTLSDTDKRMRYLLQIKGLMEDEAVYKLPNVFLMTMMELNELLEELSSNPTSDLIFNAQMLIKEQLDEMSHPVKDLLEKTILDGNDTHQLPAVKEYYFKRKYLLRIQEKLTTFAGQ